MTQKKSNSLETYTSKRLSVQISLTGLSFLVTNIARTEVVHFSEKKFNKAHTPEELLLDIETFFSEIITNVSEFESISVAYTNAEYTIVPSPLFDETKASDYLKFNSKILANDFMAWDMVETRDIHVVYVPYVNINNYLFDRFGAFQYYHSATVLLETLQSSGKFSEGPIVHIHIQETSFDIVVQNNSGLQLCNNYHFNTPEDFIYFVLFCFEQLEINPDTASVVLMGSIQKNDDLYDIAYSYIRNISFYNDPSNPLSIENAESHQHVILKNIL